MLQLHCDVNVEYVHSERKSNRFRKNTFLEIHKDGNNETDYIFILWSKQQI
jgi:hypothetical protein